jgi:hypothetical protein
MIWVSNLKPVTITIDSAQSIVAMNRITIEALRWAVGAVGWGTGISLAQPVPWAIGSTIARWVESVTVSTNGSSKGSGIAGSVSIISITVCSDWNVLIARIYVDLERLSPVTSIEWALQKDLISDIESVAISVAFILVPGWVK